MFSFALEMALLPARIAYRCVRWTVRRWRPLVRPWRSMAVPAFPQLAAPVVLGAVEPSVATRQPATGTFPSAQLANTSAEDAEQTRRAALPSPYDEVYGDPDYVLASFHSREGDGFRVVFHFLLKKQRVRRVVWLDFSRLGHRLGRDQAWAMRARLGQAQLRFGVAGPTRPWGRLELPEAWLAVVTAHDAKARGFMLETLDAVNALIEKGGGDLVSGRHQTLPVGDSGPDASLLPAPARKGTRRRDGLGRAAQQDQLFVTAPGARQDGAEIVAPDMVPVTDTPPRRPDGSNERDGLPAGVTPEHVCTGFLAGTGVTERTDSSGRNYRIFYADISVDGRVSRQTGADLERALVDAGAKIGMMVRLQHLGYVPVNGGRHRRKVWQAAVVNG